MQIDKYLDVTYPQKATEYPYLLADYLTTRFITGGEFGAPKLLDVGSGKGYFIDAFEICGMKVTSIDKDKCNLEHDMFPFHGEFFDYVFAKSLVEHIRNTENFFTEIYRVLKPGGLAIILTPDWESRYKDFFDYTHVTPFTRKALQDALEVHAFKEVSVEKFYQLPLLWTYPQLKFLARLTALLPDSWKWKDKRQTIHNEWIRFSKELMLLGIGKKS